MSCFSCNQKFKDNTLLLAHIREFHGDEDAFRCNDDSCTRSFSVYRSFARHRKLHHQLPSMSTSRNAHIVNSENNFDSVETIYESTYDAKSSHSTASNTTNNIPEFEYECSDDDEDPIPVPLKSRMRKRDSDRNPLFPDIEIDGTNIDHIRDEVFYFIAKLYDLISVPRNKVNEIINYFSYLVKIIFDNVKGEIDAALKATDNLSDVSLKITEIMGESLSILKEMKTESLRFKHFENLGTFVPPQSVVVGERREFTQCEDTSIYKMIPIKTEFIQIRNVLTKVFEFENVLDETVQYVESLKSSSYIVKNFVQGSLWKDNQKSFGDKLTLPISVYYDDYEPNNPLGSHKGVNKLGAVYFTIPCFPENLRSKLENTFLFAIFNTLDRTAVGNEMIFSKVIEELQYLAVEGITVTRPSGPVKIYFSLGPMLGDNLGLNSMQGYQENFSCNFYCRFCLTNHKDINKIFHERDCELRTEENYNEQVKMEQPSLTGIKEECVFHKISGYHVVKNPTLDVPHDLPEGVHRNDVPKFLNYFILNKKYFSLNELNAIIRGFLYDPNESNKPVEITAHQLKNNCIIMSASEMLCLVKNLPLMIGHLIPPGDEVWELFLSLKKITEIAVSDKFEVSTPDALEVEIEDYLMTHSDLFPNNFKPKHHFLIHYPNTMKVVGPLWNLSCMRGEQKNQEGKQAARSANSRKNIAHTVALRHQLRLNYRLLSARHKYSEFSISSSGHQELFDFPLYIYPDYCATNVIKRVNWIKRQHLTIKSKTIIVTPAETGPVFYEVHGCYVDTDQIVTIITKNLLAVHYDEHYDSFKIIDDGDWRWHALQLDNITSGHAEITYKVRLKNGFFYIPKKWI